MSTTQKSILVIGGTGAQGKHVVRTLVQDGKYAVTVLTRNVDSPAAKALSDLGNVTIIAGSYESEEGLRAALKGQYGVFVNNNTYSMTEARELFWTIRLFEIAVQSGVKRLVYSSLVNRPRQHRYAEEYRNSHQAMKGKLSEWLAAQPLDLIEWTILVGGVYAEMVPIAFRPRVRADGTHVFSGPLGHGHIAFTDLSSYGAYTRWILDNPGPTVGKSVYMPTFPTSLQDVANAFTRVTGKPAIGQDITQDEWFAGVEHPRFTASGPGENNDMQFSYVHSFRGWWNIWKALDAEEEKRRPGVEFADVIHPQRLKSVEDWMRATGYTGEDQSGNKVDF